MRFFTKSDQIEVQ